MSESGRQETGADIRADARAGFRGLTTGRASGYMQANIYILPQSHAAAFTGFCDCNPAACPLLAVGQPGNPHLYMLGRDIDMRCDLPAYHVHDDGLSDRVSDIRTLWSQDFVTFAIGCWFGAEGALAAAGIRMRHRETGRQGGLYRTKYSARPFGRMHGPLVVSMRPFRKADVERVCTITSKMPLSHGAPLHVGDPGALGIDDLTQAEWGEPVLPQDDEVPVFWPCGLTALTALRNSGLRFFISHAPSSMLVTDLKEDYCQ